jgi:hypothetical protein
MLIIADVDLTSVSWKHLGIYIYVCVCVCVRGLFSLFRKQFLSCKRYGYPKKITIQPHLQIVITKKQGACFFIYIYIRVQILEILSLKKVCFFVRMLPKYSYTIAIV